MMKCRKCGKDAIGFKGMQPEIFINAFERVDLFEALCEEHLLEAEHRDTHGRYYWLSNKQIQKLENEKEKKQYKKLKNKYEKP